MTEAEANFFIRRVYWLVLAFGAFGFVAYFAVAGFKSAAGFALGAVCSFGNLWIYEKLTRGIEPGASQKKPWQAGAFVARYMVLLLGGYAIVKLLGVNALAVILGLLTSTAAVLTSTIIEVVQSFLVSRSSH